MHLTDEDDWNVMCSGHHVADNYDGIMSYLNPF